MVLGTETSSGEFTTRELVNTIVCCCRPAVYVEPCVIPPGGITVVIAKCSHRGFCPPRIFLIVSGV